MKSNFYNLKSKKINIIFYYSNKDGRHPELAFRDEPDLELIYPYILESEKGKTFTHTKTNVQLLNQRITVY